MSGHLTYNLFDNFSPSSHLRFMKCALSWTRAVSTALVCLATSRAITITQWLLGAQRSRAAGVWQSKVREHSFTFRNLHWLQVPDRFKFRLAVFVFRCRNNTAPTYLSRDLHWAADGDSRKLRRLSSYNNQLSGTEDPDKPLFPATKPVYDNPPTKSTH